MRRFGGREGVTADGTTGEATGDIERPVGALEGARASEDAVDAGRVRLVGAGSAGAAGAELGTRPGLVASRFAVGAIEPIATASASAKRTTDALDGRAAADAVALGAGAAVGAVRAVEAADAGVASACATGTCATGACATEATFVGVRNARRTPTPATSAPTAAAASIHHKRDRRCGRARSGTLGTRTASTGASGRTSGGRVRANARGGDEGTDGREARDVASGATGDAAKLTKASHSSASAMRAAAAAADGLTAPRFVVLSGSSGLSQAIGIPGTGGGSGSGSRAGVRNEPEDRRDAWSSSVASEAKGDGLVRKPGALRWG